MTDDLFSILGVDGLKATRKPALVDGRTGTELQQTATASASPSACPECGGARLRQNYNAKPNRLRLLHLPEGDTPRRFRVSVYPWYCIDCARRTGERHHLRAAIPCREPGASQTRALSHLLLDRLTAMPPSEAAAGTGLSETLVRAFRDQVVASLDAFGSPDPLPPVLAIDEIYLSGEPCLHVADWESGRTEELMVGTGRAELAEWLASRRGAEGVRIVAIDPDTTLRAHVVVLLPNAWIVVDKLHMQRLATKTFIDGAKTIADAAGQKALRQQWIDRSPALRGTGRKGVNCMNAIISNRPADLSLENRAIRADLMRNVDSFARLHGCRAAFLRIFDSPNEATAWRRLACWQKSQDDLCRAVYGPLIDTSWTWREEIVAAAAVRRLGNEIPALSHRPVTTAGIEQRHASLRRLERAANGLSPDGLRKQALLQYGWMRDAVRDRLACHPFG